MSPSERALKECHPTIRQLLSVSAIYPYLNRHHLLTDEQEADLSLPNQTDFERADKLIRWLPKKGPDFLEKFVDSLQQSSQGTAHEEIVRALNKALAKNSEFQASSPGEWSGGFYPLLYSMHKCSSSSKLASYIEIGKDLVQKWTYVFF